MWVKTTVSAFKIGTDRGNGEGAEQVPGAPIYPRGVGDSNFGVVQKVGGEVRHLEPEARVVAGQLHQSEYIAVADSSHIEVPDNVDPEGAVFANLYAFSAHCYDKTLLRTGETVEVVELRTLSLGAIAIGLAFGPRVIGVGNSDLRCECSTRVESHDTVLFDDSQLDGKVDAFIDCCAIDLTIPTANPWPAYRASLEICRIDGRVVIVSLLERGEEKLDFNPFEIKWFYNEGISLIAVSRGDAAHHPLAFSDYVYNGTWHHRRYLLQLMPENTI